MVLDMARPKNKQSTIWPGMRGRDAARKLTLKVNILKVFTIDSSEIQFIVNHNAQSDGQNNSAKSGMNLHKKTIHIVPLQRTREDTKDNGILPWTKQAKMGLWNFDPIFELLSLSLSEKSSPPRIREQVEEPIHPDQYSRRHSSSSTSWCDKSEWNWQWAHKNFLTDFLFITVGFFYSR